MNTKPRFECRNAMYFKATDYSGDDIIFVKEIKHNPDGTTEPGIRIFNNFKKPVYIHKEGYRKYKQKKVWAPKSEMQVYYSTEARLDETIKKALGIPVGRYMSRRQLCRSPYVYGTDITTTSMVKKLYKDKFPKTVSPATLAVLDIETSVVSGKNEIIAISLSFKDKAITVTTEAFVGTTPMVKEKFFRKLDELTPEVRRDRHCDVEFVVCKTVGEAICRVVQRAHEWKPDFIGGWNVMAFDVPKIIKALEDEGLNPADVFSDPSIEPRFRRCVYKRGTTQKTMASGKQMGKAGYEQWHWLDIPATFYFIDQMCLYYQIRRTGPLEENYKLDTILKKHINQGKVEIEEALHVDGVDRHRLMQEKYKVEYLVYNLFDCIGLEMLDEKTGDIRQTLPLLAGISDYANYTSNPRRLADSLHFFVQENEHFNGVIGTASDQLKTEIDDYVPKRTDWIVTLPTERLQPMALDIIKEIPGLETKIHAHSADLDVASGYPNIERATNMSKDTTVHELYKIQGLTNQEVRVVGLNLVAGKVNSISIARKLFDLPSPDEMFSAFMQEQEQTA